MTEETKYLQIKISSPNHNTATDMYLAWLIEYEATSEEQKWLFEGALRMCKAIRNDTIHYAITTVTPRELIGGTMLVKDAQQIIDCIVDWMEAN